jgi:hypothetical protein
LRHDGRTAYRRDTLYVGRNGAENTPPPDIACLLTHESAMGP